MTLQRTFSPRQRIRRPKALRWQEARWLGEGRRVSRAGVEGQAGLREASSGRGRLNWVRNPESAAGMCGWAREARAGESGDRAEDSGVEVAGQGLVEIEVRNGVGLGGVEGGRLIEEPREEIALGRATGGREGRRVVVW